MIDKMLLSVADVCACTSLSKPTIHRMMARGEFPRSVRVGHSRVAWRADDVRAWVNGLPDAMPDGKGAAKPTLISEARNRHLLA
jgi:prophage regulatory protein